jgi:hypothetical protein
MARADSNHLKTKPPSGVWSLDDFAGVGPDYLGKLSGGKITKRLR